MPNNKILYILFNCRPLVGYGGYVVNDFKLPNFIIIRIVQWATTFPLTPTPLHPVY